MRETQLPAGLTIRWVPVPDERGRIRLEARWTPPTEPLAPTQVPIQAPVQAVHAA